MDQHAILQFRRRVPTGSVSADRRGDRTHGVDASTIAAFLCPDYRATADHCRSTSHASRTIAVVTPRIQCAVSAMHASAHPASTACGRTITERTPHGPNRSGEFAWAGSAETGWHDISTHGTPTAAAR